MTINSNAGGVICSVLSIVSLTGPCGIEKIVVWPLLRNESHSDPDGFLWNFSQFWSKIRLGKMRFRWKVSWMKNNLLMYDYEFTSSQLHYFNNRVLSKLLLNNFYHSRFIDEHEYEFSYFFAKICKFDFRKNHILILNKAICLSKGTLKWRQ